MLTLNWTSAATWCHSIYNEYFENKQKKKTTEIQIRIMWSQLQVNELRARNDCSMEAHKMVITKNSLRKCICVSSILLYSTSYDWMLNSICCCGGEWYSLYKIDRKLFFRHMCNITLLNDGRMKTRFFFYLVSKHNF